MAKGKKTGGRVKGVPNKLTTGAKEVIAQVAANIGGVAALSTYLMSALLGARSTSLYLAFHVVRRLAEKRLRQGLQGISQRTR
jgi:hypothetical protein